MWHSRIYGTKNIEWHNVCFFIIWVMNSAVRKILFTKYNTRKEVYISPPQSSDSE